MQLKDYLKVIRKRWWLMLIAAVVAAAVAFVYSSLQPKLYESTVTLRGDIGKSGDSGLYNGLQQQLQTYTARFTSTDLANQINQAGNFDLPPDAILSKIHVQAQPANYIFVITVDDTDPNRAKQIADVAADILVKENENAIEGLNPNQQIYIAKNAPASLPSRPSSPRTGLLSGAGAGLGLVLGAILMFVVEFFDDTLKDPQDIERYAGLTTLGQIPRWKSTDRPAQNLRAQSAFNSNGTAIKAETKAEQPKIKSNS